MTKFEVGKQYRGVIPQTGAIRLFEVVKRTPKFITIKGEMVCGTEKIKVQEVDGVEAGKYSCAWLHYELKADNAIDAPVSQPEETQKGRKTMTKITTEQAVQTAQSATTEADVQAALEQCNKNQTHEVFLEKAREKPQML